jgi:recombinational DNA repair protein (RecF pathway)
LIFELRLLKELGLAPRIDGCLKCGKNITSEAYLEAAAGGTVHVECGPGKNKVPLTAGDLASMRFISEKDLDKLAKLKIREDDARRILLSMNIFSIHHLGFKAKSLKYISEISPET